MRVFLDLLRVQTVEIEHKLLEKARFLKSVGKKPIGKLRHYK